MILVELGEGRGVTLRPYSPLISVELREVHLREPHFLLKLNEEACMHFRGEGGRGKPSSMM